MPGIDVTGTRGLRRMRRTGFGEAWAPDLVRLLGPLSEVEARARFSANERVAIVFRATDGATHVLATSRHSMTAYFHDTSGRIALEYTFTRRADLSLFLSEVRYNDHTRGHSTSYLFDFESDGTFQCCVTNEATHEESLVRGRYDPRQHQEQAPAFDTCDRLLAIERPMTLL